METPARNSAAKTSRLEATKRKMMAISFSRLTRRAMAPCARSTGIRRRAWPAAA
jgi:hypothetical protein